MTTGRGSSRSTDKVAAAAPGMIATDLATVRTAVAIMGHPKQFEKHLIGSKRDGGGRERAVRRG